MKLCPSTASVNFGIDPQIQNEPDYIYCDQCGASISVDEICEVPCDNNNIRYCCIDCYDEVCDEEGFNPQ